MGAKRSVNFCYRSNVTTADLRMLSGCMCSLISRLSSAGALSNTSELWMTVYEAIKLSRNIVAGVNTSQLYFM